MQVLALLLLSAACVVFRTIFVAIFVPAFFSFLVPWAPHTPVLAFCCVFSGDFTPGRRITIEVLGLLLLSAAFVFFRTIFVPHLFLVPWVPSHACSRSVVCSQARRRIGTSNYNSSARRAPEFV
jgi:hypothetical protein